MLNKVLGTLESTSPSGHSLRLVLQQVADRVAHSIQVLDHSSRVLAELKSVEGTTDDEWPASPALQSCSVQEIRPGQTAAFLVGMSGKSHWSASIEAIPGQGALHFDFACRVSQTPEWLGTTYLSDTLLQRCETRLQLGPTGTAVEVACAPENCAFEVRGKSLLLSCVQVAEKYPATLRWGYKIQLAVATK